MEREDHDVTKAGLLGNIAAEKNGILVGGGVADIPGCLLVICWGVSPYGWYCFTLIAEVRYERCYSVGSWIKLLKFSASVHCNACLHKTVAAALGFKFWDEIIYLIRNRL